MINYAELNSLIKLYTDKNNLFKEMIDIENQIKDKEFEMMFHLHSDLDEVIYTMLERKTDFFDIVPDIISHSVKIRFWHDKEKEEYAIFSIPFERMEANLLASDIKQYRVGTMEN